MKLIVLFVNINFQMLKTRSSYKKILVCKGMGHINRIKPSQICRVGWLTNTVKLTGLESPRLYLWEHFQRCFTERRLTLNMGDIITLTRISDWIKEKVRSAPIFISLFVDGRDNVTSSLMMQLPQLPSHRGLYLSSQIMTQSKSFLPQVAFHKDFVTMEE